MVTGRRNKMTRRVDWGPGVQKKKQERQPAGVAAQRRARQEGPYLEPTKSVRHYPYFPYLIFKEFTCMITTLTVIMTN